MPKIKRYWPCSHGFNRDPEVQELRRRYADWMGYVWQEMCAIGDLNDGEIRGTPEQIASSLAYISLLKRPTFAAKCVLNALGFMVKCGWIEIQTDHVLIVNHAKYHTTRTDKKVPPTIRPSEQPTNKIEETAMLPMEATTRQSKSGLQTEEVFRLAKELAGNDKRRAKELCNFVGKTVREGTNFGDPVEVINDAILYTLNQLKAKSLKEGKPIDEALLWPYLQQTYKFKRTKALQDESERYKKAPLNKFGDVLDKIQGRTRA